jgi:hypothetical protein
VIRINLDETYAPIGVAENLSFITFDSPQRNGAADVLLKIEIKHLEDQLLPNVYNLSFGPIDEDGEINDSIRCHHENVNKVFSTIILFSLTFLQTHRHATIGLDGSDDGRAYLYHRMFITNREYLCQFFISLGVDWYVRLLRNGTVEADTSGNPFFKPKPEPFDYNRSTRDLYRYYMSHLIPGA